MSAQGEGQGEGRENLFHAIRAGDSRHVKDLIETGIDINVKGDTGRTAFILAAEEGCVNCLKVLIRKVDDINQKDDLGNTALHAVAGRGHVDCVDSLIEFGVNLDDRNLNNESAVCVAAVNGHIKCVERLLYEVRTSFSLRDEFDNISLCQAAQNGHFDCVVELLFHTYASDNDEGEYDELLEIKRNLLSSYGKYEESTASVFDAGRLYSEQNEYSALCCASILSQPKCLIALIGRGVDVNRVQTAIGKGPPLCYAAEYGSYDCVQVLLDAGASVNLRDSLGHSALYWAIHDTPSSDEQVECVRSLVQAGADVNVRDSSGKTEVFETAVEGNDEVMEILIEAGADINVIDVDGKSVLHHASKCGDSQCVRLLLKEGAAVDIRDKHGCTPLALVANRNFAGSVRSLVLAGANIYARDVDNEEVMKATFRDKYCAEIKVNEERSQALVTAAWKGQSEQIARLIENGADVNAKVDDGTTALIAASWEGHLQCVDVLLQGDKTDVNARDYYDRTALFAAACGGHIECVETILARKGVLCDSQNKEKITPLMVAAQRQRVRCVEVLMNFGADVTSRDTAGRTALMIAAKNGNAACLQTLVERAYGSISLADALFKDALVPAIAYAHVKCVEILFKYLPDSAKSLSEVNKLIEEVYRVRDRKGDEIMSTLFKVGIFHWKWYTGYCNMYKGGIRNWTRDLILNGYTPDESQWGSITRTPLQNAFFNHDGGTVRFLMANLYLTPYDVSHFQTDSELADFVHEKCLVQDRRLHHQLVSQPWRLEVLSTLGVLNLLRRYGCKQEESVRRSGISRFLPDVFLKRLKFLNPIRYLCPYDWDNIECEFLTSNVPIKPAAENMVKTTKCLSCSTECMTINKNTQNG